MDRHQFDRRYVQRNKVSDRCGVSKPRIRSSEFFRDSGLCFGESFNVQFIDDSLVPGPERRTVNSSIEEGIDHHRLGH